MSIELPWLTVNNVGPVASITFTRDRISGEISLTVHNVGVGAHKQYVTEFYLSPAPDPCRGYVQDVQNIHIDVLQGSLYSLQVNAMYIPPKALRQYVSEDEDIVLPTGSSR